MSGISAFERQIADELEREMGTVMSFDAVAIAREATRAQRQRLLGWPPGVTRFAAGGVVLTVVAVMVLTTVRTEPRPEDRLTAGLASIPPSPAAGAVSSPGPTASPIESHAAPDDDRFISRTSFGAIEWARYHSKRPIAATARLADRILGVDQDDGSMWVSTDGIAWTRSDLPRWSERADFFDVGDEVWARVSYGGGSISMGPESHRQVIDRDYRDDARDAAIHRLDGDRWRRVKLPRLQPARVPGLKVYKPAFTDGISKDASSWIVVAESFAEVPWRNALGASTDLSPIWNEDDQVVEVFDLRRGLGVPVASSRVAVVGDDPAVIEFRDVDTGSLVHRVRATLPGWTPEALAMSLRGWGLNDVTFLVGHEGRISVVRPPWPLDEERGALATAGGRYFAMSKSLGPDYTVSGIHLWASDDGLTWEGVAPGLLPEGPIGDAELVSGHDQLLMVISPADSGSESVWASLDGRRWSRATGHESLGGWPAATSFGWLLDASYEYAFVSQDGRRWEIIRLPPLPGEPRLAALGNLLIRGPQGEDGRYVYWIGRFVGR